MWRSHPVPSARPARRCSRAAAAAGRGHRSVVPRVFGSGGDRRRSRTERRTSPASGRAAHPARGPSPACDRSQHCRRGCRRSRGRAASAMLSRGCHSPAFAEQGPDLPVVALVGRPKVGKSTLFGVATGRFGETVNAPGTTLAASRRTVHFPEGDAYVLDLPGTLSLEDSPAGGGPFWRDLVAARPDAILVVGDAGDLRRHLPLALACRDLGLPIVFAANLSDEATARGIDVDAGRLSQLLAAPVHKTIGRSGRGVGAAVAQAVSLARQRRA